MSHLGVNLWRETFPELRFLAVVGGSKKYVVQGKVRHILFAGERPQMKIRLTAPVPEFYSRCTGDVTLDIPTRKM